MGTERRFNLITDLQLCGSATSAFVGFSLSPSVSRRTALCVSVLTTTRAWWPPTARCVTGDAVATSDRNVAAASPSPSTPQVQLHGTS